MKKVGIITFHYSNNFGGVLQAYALQQTLSLMDINSEIINYIPKNSRTPLLSLLGLSKKAPFKAFLDLVNIHSFLKLKVYFKYKEKITRSFDEFRLRNMNIGKKLSHGDFDLLDSRFDYIITGSDQVWNPSQRSSPIYFLNFDFKRTMKISYAADSTTSEIADSQFNYLKNAFESFSSISVRNKHSYEFASQLTDREISIVADPTLLIDFDENFDCDISKLGIDGDYIITYILGDEIEGSHKKTLKLIKDSAGEMPVYSIKIPTMKFEVPNYADKTFYDLGPVEWVALIKNAKFVYTDSFHGVLFAMKYNKPFLSYYKEALRATRFLDLAERYEISDFIVDSLQDAMMKESVKKAPNYEKINKIIEKQRKESIDFLLAALK